MIVFENFCFKTRQDISLMENISVTFDDGKVHALVGPNGSGKTTLLRAICNLIPATSGSIKVDNLVTSQTSSLELARTLSWTESEHMTPFAYTVEDTILWGRWPVHLGSPSIRDQQEAHDAAHQLGIAEKLNRSVTTLSLGERKKAHLAKSLASGAKHLIWDEPCAPLDIRASLEVLEIARARARAGQTVILSVHDINLISRYADTLTILNNGQLRWHGKPSADQAISELESTFGVKITRRGSDLCFDL